MAVYLIKKIETALFYTRLYKMDISLINLVLANYIDAMESEHTLATHYLACSEKGDLYDEYERADFYRRFLIARDVEIPQMQKQYSFYKNMQARTLNG